jgi:hypothetical protein
MVIPTRTGSTSLLTLAALARSFWSFWSASYGVAGERQKIAGRRASNFSRFGKAESGGKRE